MGGIRVITTTTIHTRTHHVHDVVPRIDLTPWDLRLLRIPCIQRGLLFHNPKPENHVAFNVIQHLQHSLSSTLQFFPPLVGRLAIVQHMHEHDNTSSVSITCNNAGALFVHAIAHDTTVSDILEPPYVPPIVRSFFPLNREGTFTSKPLLAVQVTELVDGIFIGCSISHSIVDGTSFWHFFNSWAEISRGLDEVSKPPALERWFPHGVNRPVHFPSYTERKQDFDGLISSQPAPQRVFHFATEKIAELKAKANAEVNDNTNKIAISSLQALLSHIWRCVIRNQCLDPQEEVSCVLLMGLRQRILHPSLAANYFGNAIQGATITMKAGELLEGGVGKAALEMNRTIGVQTEEKLKGHYESWINNPVIFEPNTMRLRNNTLVVSSSPRFDIYGNDFGWGQPLAVRCGSGLTALWKLTLFEGSEEEGSIEVHVCIASEILEAMARDSEFMDAVSL